MFSQLFTDAIAFWKPECIMKKHALECVVYGHEAEPSYLSFSRIADFLGVLHQRFAPGFMRPSILAFGKVNEELV